MVKPWGIRSLWIPPIELQHARIVEAEADRRVRTVLLAQKAGVGFDLRREEAAEFGQSGGWGSMIGVCGLVVDDPPAVFSFSASDSAGAEDAVCADGAQAAAEDSCPCGLGVSAGVGRENPLAHGIVCRVERVLERLGGDLGGLGRIYAGGADSSSDAGFEAPQGSAGGSPIAGFAQAG